MDDMFDEAVGRLEQLIDRVQGLSGDFTDIAQRLLQLQHDLVDPEERTRWGIPAAQILLAPDSFAERYRASAHRYWAGPLSILEWVRNVVVLLPIVLTWIGLSLAAAGYAAELKANPKLFDTPFLLLWEQGFGPSPFSFLTFSHVALADAVLIACVVVLTFVVHGASTLREQAILDTANQLRLQVDETRSTVVLALVRAGRSDHLWVANHISSALTKTIGTFEQKAEEMLDHLALERSRIVEYSQQRESEVSALAAFSTNLVSGAEAIGTEAIRVSAAAESFEAAGRSLRVDLGRLDQLFQAQIQVVDRLSGIVNALGASFQGAQLTFKDASQSVIEASAAVGSGAQLLVSHLQSLDQHAAAIGDKNTRLLEALQTEQTVRSASTDALWAVSERIKTLDQAIAQFEEHFATIGTAFGRSSERFDQGRERIEQAVGSQAQAFLGMKDGLDKLATIQGQVLDLLADLAEALRATAATWSDVRESTAARQEASERFEKLAAALVDIAEGRSRWPLVTAERRSGDGYSGRPRSSTSGRYER